MDSRKVCETCSNPDLKVIKDEICEDCDGTGYEIEQPDLQISLTKLTQ